MTTKAETLRALPEFEDPRVQIVYEMLCDDTLNRPPNHEEHWEGWVSRNIVAALAPSIEGQAGGDADHPDCSTARECELYDALMGLAGHAMANYPGYRNWEQGGLVLAPVVARALRLRDAGCAVTPQQRCSPEPIAYRWRTLPRYREDGDIGEWSWIEAAPDFMNPHHHEVEPLYAAPPAPDRATDPDAMNDQRCLDDMRLASNVRAAVIEEAAKKVVTVHFARPETAPNSPTSLAIEALFLALPVTAKVDGPVSGNDRASEGGK